MADPLTHRIRALAVLGAALALAGCGGSDTTSDEEKAAEANAQVDELLEKEGPLAGLGEASPPPSGAAQWETDFSKTLVSLEEFQPGGPPKDGIPAIDAPRFTRAHEVDWLDELEPVIVVEADGETRAYPIQILMWHEIVNDEIGRTPVAVTFCPLCNTAIVFDRRVSGDVLDFGTTGKLRDSDLVMYDRQTESWWQQFSGEAARRRTGRKGARASPRADSRVERLQARASLGAGARRGHRVRPRLRREPVRRLRQRRLVTALRNP